MPSGGSRKPKKAAVSKKKKKEELTRSSEASSRGIRERTKWRKHRREMELKRLEEKRIQEEAEQLRRKTEEQKKVFKKAYEEFERSLQDSESLQKEVETVLSDYRKAKNHFKIKVQFESNDFIATQQIENTQFSAAADRIRSSEIQLFKMEGELEKTKQIRDDYIRDLNQSWYTRLWRFLY